MCVLCSLQALRDPRAEQPSCRTMLSAWGKNFLEDLALQLNAQFGSRTFYCHSQLTRHTNPMFLPNHKETRRPTVNLPCA